MPGDREQERNVRGDTPPAAEAHAVDAAASKDSPRAAPRAGAEQRREVGGPKGPEPTRFGDWERAGRCVDF